MNSLKNNNSGAALLTVLIAMALITLMLFEFQYSSMVERKLAFNELNRLQAQYLAKSGARIGLLRLALYSRIQRDKTIQNYIKQFPPVEGMLRLLYELPLPPFPPDPKTMAQLTEKKDKEAANEFLKNTRVTLGQSSHVISSQGSKINLNFLQLPEGKRSDRLEFRGEPKSLQEYIGQTLINLINNFLLESDDPYEEYGNLRPEEIVYNIIDWVTPGDYSQAGGDKDRFYEALDPPYKAKRNRFFTVDELRMVKDITPLLFSKLQPQVTVWSYDGKININTASNKILKALYPDFTEDDLKAINEQKAQQPGGWASVKQFVDYIVTTLGEAGFQRIYNDEKNYPFTVDTQSFFIESSGTIQKSASSVRANIKIAVALARAKEDRVKSLTQYTNQPECDKNGGLWNVRGTFCSTKPESPTACQGLGGEWADVNGKQCCKLIGQNVYCPKDADAKGDANSLKILYWAES